MDIARVQRITAFQDLAEHDLKQIVLLAKEKSVPEGTDLVRQGDFSNDIICIVEGSAKVVQDGAHIADLTVGDILGEGGVLEKTRRGATVTAVTPVVVFTLGSLEINRLRKTAPLVVERLQAIDDSRNA